MAQSHCLNHNWLSTHSPKTNFTESVQRYQFNFLICEMSLKNTLLKLLPHHSGANELKIGHQDCSASRGHLSDMPCSVEVYHDIFRCVICRLFLSFQEHKRLAEAIERESFAQHGRLINHNYRRSTRALVFAIKNKPELIEQLVSLQLPIKDFVTEHKKFPKSSS